LRRPRRAAISRLVTRSSTSRPAAGHDPAEIIGDYHLRFMLDCLPGSLRYGTPAETDRRLGRGPGRVLEEWR
jgi:hypothetical protein